MQNKTDYADERDRALQTTTRLRRPAQLCVLQCATPYCNIFVCTTKCYNANSVVRSAAEKLLVRRTKVLQSMTKY